MYLWAFEVSYLSVCFACYSKEQKVSIQVYVLGFELAHGLLQVNNLPVNILPVGYANQGHGQSSYSSDDLPKNVVTTLSQGSVVKSMDFHPQQQTLLLGMPQFALEAISTFFCYYIVNVTRLVDAG